MSQDREKEISREEKLQGIKSDRKWVTRGLLGMLLPSFGMSVSVIRFARLPQPTSIAIAMGILITLGGVIVVGIILTERYYGSKLSKLEREY